MKKYFVILMLVIGGMMSAVAQGDGSTDRQNWFKQMQNHKAESIAHELDLTDQQRESFLPLYKEMDDKLAEASRSVREVERKVRKKGTAATDAEYQKGAEAMFQLKAQESKIETLYYQKFAKILTKRQLFLLKGAERDFMRKVMDQHRKRPARKTSKK